MSPEQPNDWSLKQRAATSRGSIVWDVLGEGLPVVLVHGTPSRAYLWRHVAAELAQSFRVYVYDLLGYGASDRRAGQDVSIRVQARVLAELVHHWGLEAPAMVGHDVGGAIVLRAHLLEGIAARKVALIDAVVLRPWITNTSRHIQRHLEVYKTMPTHIFREVAAAHLRTATATPMGEQVFETYFAPWEGEQGQANWLNKTAQFDEAQTAEFEPLLASMETPTRVIWGDQDAWLDPALSEDIAGRLPRADRVLIPGAGHFSMEDKPAEVAAALLDFLSSDDG